MNNKLNFSSFKLESWEDLSNEDKMRLTEIYLRETRDSKSIPKKPSKLKPDYSKLGFVVSDDVSLIDELDLSYIDCLTSGKGYKKLFINLHEISSYVDLQVGPHLIQCLYIAKFKGEYYRPKDLIFWFKKSRTTANRLSDKIKKLSNCKGLKDLPLPPIEEWESKEAKTLAALFLLSIHAHTNLKRYEIHKKKLLAVPLEEIGRAIQIKGSRVSKFLKSAGLEKCKEKYCDTTRSVLHDTFTGKTMIVSNENENINKFNFGYTTLPCLISMWCHPFPPSIEAAVNKRVAPDITQTARRITKISENNEVQKNKQIASKEFAILFMNYYQADIEREIGNLYKK